VGEGRGDTLNRAIDVAAASLGLAVTSPLLAVAALGIKLEDGGRVLYRQRRVGLRGREFELLKLRSMVPGA
jgi:lipopolysaccharide/colanic/teichoic acid biosynthesis glycosyltransferase